MKTNTTQREVGREIDRLLLQLTSDCGAQRDAARERLREIGVATAGRFASQATMDLLAAYRRGYAHGLEHGR